jgi:hypothetical protein
LTLLHTHSAYLGLGDEECFHCDDCTFVSGSRSYTHVSSPVITVFRNSGSLLAHSSMSRVTSRRSFVALVKAVWPQILPPVYTCANPVSKLSAQSLCWSQPCQQFLRCSNDGHPG